MEIQSPAFGNNQKIPAKYTCDGENINPPFTFSDIPVDTKSLALIMDDPDVPKTIRADGMWNHLLVWNMPAGTKGIPENSLPLGIVGKNTSGQFGYQGPCPPDREHRYFFKLYALDTMLNLDQSATKKELEKAMEGHIKAYAELIGRYKIQLKTKFI